MNAAHAVARILVAEDEGLVRELLIHMLQLEGHAVTGAADGAATLEALRGEGFDLAIVDVRMEGMSGLEALERAAREGHPVRAIVLTGDQADDAVHATARRLSARVVAKPVRRADLVAHVDALLARAPR